VQIRLVSRFEALFHVKQTFQWKGSLPRRPFRSCGRDWGARLVLALRLLEAHPQGVPQRVHASSKSIKRPVLASYAASTSHRGRETPLTARLQTVTRPIPATLGALALVHIVRAARETHPQLPTRRGSMTYGRSRGGVAFWAAEAARFRSAEHCGSGEEPARPPRSGGSRPKARVAHRAGFEPTTPRFVVWCSIQLSYRCFLRASRAEARLAA
jgi:hypothetical protein